MNFRAYAILIGFFHMGIVELNGTRVEEGIHNTSYVREH